MSDLKKRNFLETLETNLLDMDPDSLSRWLVNLVEKGLITLPEVWADPDQSGWLGEAPPSTVAQTRWQVLSGGRLG